MTDLSVKNNNSSLTWASKHILIIFNADIFNVIFNYIRIYIYSLKTKFNRERDILSANKVKIKTFLGTGTLYYDGVTSVKLKEKKL